MIGRDGSNWFSAVAHSVANRSEDGLILNDQSVRQLPGHIGRSHDRGDTINCVSAGHINRQNAGVWMRTT
jgi:hypothetical protein